MLCSHLCLGDVTPECLHSGLTLRAKGAHTQGKVFPLVSKPKCCEALGSLVKRWGVLWGAGEYEGVKEVRKPLMIRSMP